LKLYFNKSIFVIRNRTKNFYGNTFLYGEKEFDKKKVLKALSLKKNEKNFFFEKLGLQAKPDCRGNRLNSETFNFGFFPKIEFSRSLY